MLLQGVIASREAKGFLINFGLKDKALGFLSFDQESERLQLGELVHVVVRSAMASSKVIKCELPQHDETRMRPVNSKELTIHNLKPGFLVAARVQRTLDNGIELGFLGGFSGTVFVDHLDKDLTKFKLGERVTARMVSVDAMAQAITLSLLPHIVKLESVSLLFTQEGLTVGKLFEKVPVSKVAFGESYQI
jgi:ribosomal protein S1